MIVVDASLAAKWIIAEPDSAHALQFLFEHGHDLGAPDIIHIEVTSAIVRRANENKSLLGNAMQAFDKWTKQIVPTTLTFYPTTMTRLSVAARLALQLGHPIADCIYLALAIEFKCDLATSDARFVKKARTVWNQVRLLTDYPLATGT